MGRPQLGLPRLLAIKVRPPPARYYSAELESAIEMMAGLRRLHEKGPGAVRGLPHFLAGSVCTNQAVAVRNFLIVISSFARSQSSWSWPSSRPRSS